MTRFLSLALPALLLTSAPAFDARAESPAELAGQYSAEYDLGSHEWHLLPFEGAELAIRSIDVCGTDAPLSEGVWLLTHDGDGALALLAPSSTPLPPGHTGLVPLVDCDSPAVPADDPPAFAVPRQLRDLLARQVGAVMIHE